MDRRALLISLFAASLFLPSLPLKGQQVQFTPQDQADLARIQAYLNGIRSLKARFMQIAPNGATSGGTVWLERPGRMRFQYDPPSPLLLVAGHGLVVFHDASLNQTSNIPLGQTPLGILLSDNIRLSGDVTVTGIQRLPNQLRITLLRTTAPGEGSLTLVFSENPLVLRQWTVLDAQRQSTTVTLYDVQPGGHFDPKLFEFVDPRFFQNNQGGGG